MFVFHVIIAEIIIRTQEWLLHLRSLVYYTVTVCCNAHIWIVKGELVLNTHCNTSIVLSVFPFLQRNASIVRMWILLSIIETTILLAINLAGSIYFAVMLHSYYGLSIIALQIIVSCK